MKKYNVRLIALLIFLVHVMVLGILYKIIIFCDQPNCILLGGDTLTQIQNYVKLSLPELWISNTNYGYPTLHNLPGIILYALFLKAVYMLTGSRMVLTFYIVETITLSVGSVGLHLFLTTFTCHHSIKNKYKSNIGISSIVAVVIYVINPGLWINLYHGLIEYLLGYSITPWILLVTYKLIKSLFKEKNLLKTTKHIIVAVILTLLMPTHPISFSVMTLVILSYAILHVSIEISKNREKNLLEISSKLAVVLSMTFMLLLPYFYLYVAYSNLVSPSADYVKIIMYTHRDVKEILGWHALSVLEALAKNDNMSVPLGLTITIILSMTFSSILTLIIIFWKKFDTINRVETMKWLLLYIFFLTLSMGAKAPYPLDQLNLIMFKYIPLIRIVGCPCRFAMASGFCISVLVGIFILSIQNSKDKSLSYLKFSFRLSSASVKLTVILTLILATVIVGRLSVLTMSVEIPQQYYDLSKYLEKRDCGFVYIVPSTEWVIPSKLTNSNAIIEAFRGATVMPWPHNILAYVLSMKNVPVITGSYVKPYFDYIVKTRATDLLPLLFQYLNIRYIAVDDYVEPTIKWLELEGEVFKKQALVHKLSSFGNISLFEVESLSNNAFIDQQTTVYKRYGIVATNMLKLTLLSLSNHSILNVYPVILDEESLPTINELLKNAYYAMIDKTGFYDILAADMIRNNDTIALNAFLMLENAKYSGECRIEATRLGWSYSGKPYYSIFDGVLKLGKGAILNILVNLPATDNYVVLIRFLTRDFGGYVEVNEVSRKIEFNANGLSLYVPRWFAFTIHDNNARIKVEAENDIYLDYIVIAPYSIYLRALNDVVEKLSRIRTYTVLTPTDINAERIRQLEFFGLGCIAQGELTINIPNYVKTTTKYLYLIMPKNGTVNVIQPSYLNPVMIRHAFNKYKILKYQINSNDAINLFIPYAVTNIGYGYRNNSLILHGFGSYLWALPLKEINKYGYITLQLKIDVKNYQYGDAFGIALFHNMTSGYEVKFTYTIDTDEGRVYSVSLIDRREGKPYIIGSSSVVVGNRCNSFDIKAYVDIIHKETLITLNGIPYLCFKIKNLSNNLFGIVQWGRNAKITVNDAKLILSDTLDVTYMLDNIWRKGYGSILYPILTPEKQVLNLSISINPYSFCEGSAIGIALYHDGENGFEIKMPLVRNGVVEKVEIWKRINGTPILINSFILRTPINISQSQHCNIQLRVKIIRDDNNKANVNISIENQSIITELDMHEIEAFGKNVGIITWGAETIINILKFNVSYLNIAYDRKLISKKYDLLKISVNNGIAGIIWEYLPTNVIDNSSSNLFVVVYYQSYRKGWNIQLPRKVELLLHLRGFYGVTNIYIVETEDCIDVGEILSSSSFQLMSSTYTAVSVMMFVIYVIAVTIFAILTYIIKKVD